MTRFRWGSPDREKLASIQPGKTIAYVGDINTSVTQILTTVSGEVIVSESGNVVRKGAQS